MVCNESTVGWLGIGFIHISYLPQFTRCGYLNCQSGVWAKATLDALKTVVGNNACGAGTTSIANCPAGTRLISGGWKLTAWSGDGVQNAPDTNMPRSNTAWYIITGGSMKGGQCLAAVVNCAN